MMNCTAYVNAVGLDKYNGYCSMFGGEAILSQGLGELCAALLRPSIYKWSPLAAHAILASARSSWPRRT